MTFLALFLEFLIKGILLFVQGNYLLCQAATQALTENDSNCIWDTSTMSRSARVHLASSAWTETDLLINEIPQMQSGAFTHNFSSTLCLAEVPQAVSLQLSR